MFKGAIMGEEFEGEAAKSGSFLDKIGGMTKSLLETGAQVYTVGTQRKIADTQLERERLAATTAELAARRTAGSGLLGGSSVSSQAGMMGGGMSLPIIPIVAGLGGIGLILLLTRKGKKK